MISYYNTTNGKICKVDEYQEHCWINVIAPTEEEVTRIIQDFNIEPDFMRSALDEEESSRIENEDGKTLIIIDVPFSEKIDESIIYYTMPMGIIVGERNVITVSLKNNAVLTEFSEGIVKNAQTNLRTQFVLHILYRMANRFLQYLKQIDKMSGTVETQLRRSMRNRELTQLLDLEKSLVYFSTSLKSNEITIEKILRGRFIKLYDEDQDLLEDVLIEIKQAIDMANIYLSILSGTMDAFASVISNNLNIVMKILTSLTVLMSIPTLIFSFYGMNTSVLPLSMHWAYPLSIGLLLTAVSWYWLWKKNMF